MRLPYILLTFTLLATLAFSAPADDSTVNFTGETIEAAHFAQDHAKDILVKEEMFIGSTKSDKYHYPDCRAAKNIKPENKIWFSSSEDARAHGYVPCGICHPP
jgi:methylphosphotriester-DNA--protein-cysteine methyltransferase